ncbi:MAG: hypothetical protein AAF675_13730 [Pseudomonadota bacterium]
MILSEAGSGPVAAPLAEFKEHLRLGHGFADDGAEDGLLARYLSHAVAVVEHETGRALTKRRFELAVSRWDRDGCLAMPVGPVSAIVSAVLEGAGTTQALDTSVWTVSAEGTRGILSAGGGLLPFIPVGHVVRITFDAGIADDWTGVPGGLEQAVMMLAADFHARRGTERDGKADIPQVVRALIGPWRPGRL